MMMKAIASSRAAGASDALTHADLPAARNGSLRRVAAFCSAGVATLGVALTLGLATPSAVAAEADHPADQPIAVGSDFGLAPWMVRNANGPEGFGVDLVTEIAKRIGRPGVKIDDINFSGIFPALFSKRIEFTVAPINITKDRSEKMLFTEPIVSTGNGFLMKKSTDMKGFEDLKGKVLAVNRGTIGDTWATNNAEKYGFTVDRYDTFPDTMQAVLTNRAYATLNEIPTVVFAASKNKMVKVGFKDLDGRNFGFAFRLDDEAYRNKVEQAIECMKADGSLRKMYIKWYGAEPDKGSAVDTIYPGYGAPGFKGYDAAAHPAVCK
jgi:polar amino acid transport system substrate-binding protein